ncbi:MAG: alpha/beta hydrolase [Syntrophomonadaceae bacterium]|nr:alpha/beta hydrolase [Syntrophomonadaceae bacterium]
MAEYIENTGDFTGLYNTCIFYQSWQAEHPRGVVVIAHGVGEYSGRYRNLLNRMQGDGISFYALDHRGHGRSEGKKGHINSFNDYTADLKTFIQMVRAETTGLPLTLLGHSMGGTIACKFALDYPGYIDGLLLSSAGFIQAVRVPGWKKGMAALLSNIMPGLSMPTGLDRSALSHDQQAVDDYANDPLVHDLVSARWYMEFSRAGEECLQRAGELTLPLLIIHGSADTIVDPQGSRQVMEKASSPDKQLFIFDGLYHETMNESPPEREKVLDTFRSWIIRQVEGKTVEV